MAVAVRADALSARIGGLGLPAGQGPARQAALARLAGMGLPGRRDEYWRYTDAAPLNAEAAPAVPVVAGDAGLHGVGGVRLVFTDGVFDAAASDDPAQAGVEVVSLADGLPGWADGLYGQLEVAGQVPVARPFAALNTAFAPQGVAIRVTGRAVRPVALVYRRMDAAADVMLHHLLRVEPGAELTLLEQGLAGARVNQVMEVDLADGAGLHHIRLQGCDAARCEITHLFARLGAGSRLKSFTLSSEGRLTRNEAVIDLAGAGGAAHLAGVAIGEGAFHHDDTVLVTHGAPGCESRQVFKKVLHRGAVGVFQGKIHVRRVAQKTDGYQKSQALLLDEDSQFLAKPELEIYADDVKCSHGATSGAIDETGLFYLRSRGVPQDRARALLVLAFLAEALAEIEDAAIAGEVRNLLDLWLGTGLGTDLDTGAA